MHLVALFFSLLLSFQISFANNLKKPIAAQNKRGPASVTKPKPSPSPGLKKGEFATMKSKTPLLEKIVITPKPVSQPISPNPENQITFLQPSQSKGVLILKFQTKSSDFYLSHAHPITVHLMTRPPLSVDPALVITSDWPKNANQISIKVTGVQKSDSNRIWGKAAYTFCNQKTKVCTKTTSNIVYNFQP